MTPNRSLLASLTKTDLDRTVFPVIDALVAFVPEGQRPTQPVQAQLDARGYQRWFPTEGGHLVKMPYQGDSVPMEHFHVELGGWDHDHCEACGGRIEAGAECWATREADFKLVCDTCFGELK